MAETVGRVLAIAAHPDDETLGCGGSLLRHGADGDELHWLVTTRAHEPQWSADVIAAKDVEVEAVARAYGMVGVHRLGFPSLTLDMVPQAELIGAIRRVVESVRPTTVYVVNLNDVHTDHAAVHLAAMSVLKPFYMRALGVQRILAFETLSSTEGGVRGGEAIFTPRVYVDISEFLPQKIEIMSLFATERQEDPLPRGPAAIRALARLRGSAVGVEYAEAFALIREVR